MESYRRILGIGSPFFRQPQHRARASELLGVMLVRVWLSRKLAQFVNGVDLSGRKVGDVLDLSAREAWLLVADGYAEPDRRLRIDRRAVSRAGVSKDRRRPQLR